SKDETRLKVAFVAFDSFCGAYINNYLCRVHTITVEKCFPEELITFVGPYHGRNNSSRSKLIVRMREGGYDVSYAPHNTKICVIVLYHNYLCSIHTITVEKWYMHAYAKYTTTAARGAIHLRFFTER
ncbi:hypothetical protein ACJX0J_019270, partial [Zea mays]